MSPKEGKPIIFFDGYCNLCTGSVQFILRRDKYAQFLFCSLQSPKAESYIGKQSGNSIVLWDNGKIFQESTAVLHIAKKLDGIWKLLYVLIIVPKFIRDALYRFVARNRYRCFGRKASCMVPTAELRQRFLV